jgi:ribulose-5-phosphate 4-epimerase/fuculose-1-phosphate aldolase
MLEVMGNNDICLLNRHGVVIAGKSVADAVHRLIELEHAARINWMAALFGKVDDIPEQDKEEWRARRVLAAEAMAKGLPDLLHPGGEDDDPTESGETFVDDSGLGM